MMGAGASRPAVMEERSAVEYGRLREIAERLAEPGGTAHALKPEVGMRGPECAGARGPRR